MKRLTLAHLYILAALIQSISKHFTRTLSPHSNTVTQGNNSKQAVGIAETVSLLIVECSLDLKRRRHHQQLNPVNKW